MLGVVLIVAVVGAFSLRLLLPLSIDYLMRQENPDRVFTAVEMMVTLIFLGCIPVVFYVFALGRRSINSERFLPSGKNSFRDAQPMKGHREVIRGQMMVFIAILLIVFAFLGWMYSRFFIQSLSGK